MTNRNLHYLNLKYVEIYQWLTFLILKLYKNEILGSTNLANQKNYYSLNIQYSMKSKCNTCIDMKDFIVVLLEMRTSSIYFASLYVNICIICNMDGNKIWIQKYRCG